MNISLMIGGGSLLHAALKHTIGTQLSNALRLPAMSAAMTAVAIMAFVRFVFLTLISLYLVRTKNGR